MRLDPYVYRSYPLAPIPVPPLVDRGYARSPIPSAGLGPIVTGLNGLPLGQDPTTPATDPATAAADLGPLRTTLRNKLLATGIPGVFLGATILTLLSAWAFHADDPHLPKWKPALILGGGSLLTGVAVVTGTAIAIGGPHPLLGMFVGGAAMGRR
jgi:hypothetical protein